MNKGAKMGLCECGCEQVRKPDNRFINGHATKGKPSPRKGKTYEEIFGGKERAKQLRKEHSKTMKGREVSELHRKHLSEAFKGKPGHKQSEETKLKIKQKMKEVSNTREARKTRRLNRIKQIELNNVTPYPNYNKEACEFFKSFDEYNNTKGRYAIYGNGEYFISELGYWADYFNSDLKLIMEYDEPSHYENGNLKSKDLIRQQEIQQLYPDFDFRRIKVG